MAGVINLPIVSKFFDKGIRDATKGMGKLGKGLAGVGIAAGAAFAAVGAVGTAFVVASAKQLMEIEKLNAQTNAAIKSTGSAAGRTVDQINELNGSLEKLTGIEAEVIQEGQNMLLTFTKINGKQFDRATEAALDLSVALGKDMQSAAMLVGKALNDPIGGISALSRAGIQFTEDQKNTIAAMVELNDTAGAQSIILEELNKQFGGSAEAFGETAAGKFAKLENELGELGETIAVELMPAFELFVEELRAFIEKHGPEMEGAFSGIGDFAVSFVDQLSDISNWIADNPETLTNVAVGIVGISTALLALDASLKGNPIGLLASGLALLVGATATGLIDFQVIGKKLNDFWTDVAFNFAMTTDGLVNGVIDVLNALNAPMRGFLGLMNDVFGTNFDTSMLGHINNTMGLAVKQLQNQGINYGYTGGAASNNPGGYGNPAFGLMPRLMATGGIVTRPLNAIVGEAGPEAIIPLNRMGSMGGQTVNVTVNTVAGDPVAIERVVLDAISRASRRGTTRLAV